MARGTKQRFATIGVATIFAMVARMVALCFLVPALFVNVDWSGQTGWAWNLAAAGSIVGSAVFIEAAWHARSVLMSPLYLLLGVLLMACNFQVAFENASHASDHRSDHRKGAMVAAKNASSQRSQWSQGRSEAATVAGETASATYKSQIDAAIAADSKRWQGTGECDALKITAGESKAFCAGIANLRAKLAAADRRDELDRKIETLDGTATAEAPTSADPFAENVAAFLRIFNVTVTDATKEALSAQKNVLRSLTLELLATFGPTAWLLMVNAWLSGAASKPSTRSEKVSTKAPKVDTSKGVQSPETPPVAAIEHPVALDDPFHRFVAEALDEHSGVMMPAGEPWQLWLSWCAQNAKEGGSQKAFGTKMKARFAWEPNNNRPRYLNVRAKPAAPSLRIVGGKG